MNDKVRTRSTGLAGVTNLAVLAPLRQGMVPGPEPISYVGRLRKVLDALHASRRNLRESELWSVFPDAVGRFGFIHGFRYALVKPEAAPAGMPADFGTWRLSLNVTFDGGWEPYMRVIYRDIGTLLDLLFCHSPGYLLSSEVDFDKYSDWVRRHEVPAGLFFADSGATVDDAHYLAKVEALQREGASSKALARCHLREADAVADVLAKGPAHIERAMALPLRTLKGLYRLTVYFQPYADGPVLRRFAQHVLAAPAELMRQIDVALSAANPGGPQAGLATKWSAIKTKLMPDELAWLGWDRHARPPEKTEEIVDPAALQAHVLGTDERMTHACLVMLQVKDAEQALKTIATLAERCRPVADGKIGCMVGFTYSGLQALGVTSDQLAALPQEFYEGMEVRASLLGDLRTNHPDRWTRPPLYGQSGGQRLDLQAVHLLVQMRLQDDACTDDCHPRLHEEVSALHSNANGLRVLAAEPMRSYRDREAALAKGLMGFADGLSQPRIPSAPASKGKYHNDQVSTGELLLGYANDRGDRTPATNALLHNGSFLAVRKLRQFMERLGAQSPPAGSDHQDLLEKMVGRRADGEPLHERPTDSQHINDFNFDTQVASDACPFQSHIRRINPRDGRDYTPRILRRGMSWVSKGKDKGEPERGVMFMAYCASLSEQFEVVQRWVAGGNASGVGSSQGDPLLRVPKEGETSTFRYLDEGRVRLVKLPAEPLVQLQWGLYAFVPSLKVLESLADFTEPVAAAATAHQASDLPELEVVRAQLEDRDKSKTVWKWVRDRDPRAPQRQAYGHLLGTLDEVLAVLRDDGRKYSVAGYAERMNGSIGLNILGMDPTHPRRIKEEPVKAAIASVTEDVAFDEALVLVKQFMTRVPTIPSAVGDVSRRAVDLVDLSSHVLAQLCKQWFGLPDGANLIAGGYQSGAPIFARCPGSLGPASRYMFMPHPDVHFAPDGRAHAKAVHDAVGTWLAGNPNLTRFPVSRAIQAALQKTKSTQYLAENIAGAMLGFTPAVQSNFLKVIETWLEEGASLWLHQQSLFEQSPGESLTYQHAKDALRAPLMAAMRKNPVPTMVFRSPVTDGKPDTDPSQRVVLGLESALADPHAPDVLVFGRDSPMDSTNTTVHGCPGYGMAVGVLLAMIGELMKAGTLRPTGSPALLILTQP